MTEEELIGLFFLALLIFYTSIGVWVLRAIVKALNAYANNQDRQNR